MRTLTTIKLHLLLFVVTFQSTVFSSSVQDTDLTTFASGTKAVAQEVNDNFTALKTAINDNQAQITELTNVGSNFISNPNFDIDTSGWTATDGTANHIAVTGAPSGTQAVSNSSNTVLSMHSDTWIQIDQSKTFEVKGGFKLETIGGTTGTLVLAVLLRDASGTILDGSFNSNGSGGTWWHYAVNSITPADNNWTQYQALFGNNTAIEFPNEAVEMTVGVILNSGAGDRVYQAQGLHIASVSSPSAWIDLPLTSGITAYAGYQAPQYRKQSDQVCLRGITDGANAGIADWTFTASAQTIANLPPTFRPPAHLIFTGAGSPNRSIDRIDVMSTGEIIVNRNNADAWVSLDGICFSTLP